MGKRIDEFLATVKDNGLSRNNKFKFRIYPPRALVGGNFSFRKGPFFGDVELRLPNLGPLEPLISGGSVIGDIAAGALGSIRAGVDLPNLGYALSNLNGFFTEMELYCANVTLPSRDIEFINYRPHGEFRKIGWNHTYSPLSAEFYCSHDFRERMYLELWQQLIFNKRSGSVAYYDDYTSYIDVMKYDAGNNEVTARWRFYECFPNSVGEQRFDNNDGEVSRCPIQFTYRYFESR